MKLQFARHWNPIPFSHAPLQKITSQSRWSTIFRRYYSFQKSWFRQLTQTVAELELNLRKPKAPQAPSVTFNFPWDRWYTAEKLCFKMIKSVVFGISTSFVCLSRWQCQLYLRGWTRLAGERRVAALLYPQSRYLSLEGRRSRGASKEAQSQKQTSITTSITTATSIVGHYAFYGPNNTVSYIYLETWFLF